MAPVRDLPSDAAVTATRLTPRPRAPAPPRPQPTIGERSRRVARSPKGLLTLVFAPLLLLGGAAEGWALVLPHVLTALLGAGLTELALRRLVRRRWRWPSSALLSGLITAFVLAPVEPRPVTFAVAALATASKYLLRTRHGHVFNPAALALLVSVPLFGAGQSWWGALADLPGWALVLLLACGALLLDRLNKFPLALSFLGIYFGLFAFAGLLAPARAAEMFRVPFVNAALFLACCMLTDPPTSPSRRDEQVWIGGVVAVVSAVAQVVGVGQTYLLVGLLAGNLTLATRRWAGRLAATAALRAARQPAERPRAGASAAIEG